MKIFGCLLITGLLAGCGGGSPYVGLWQCANEPAASLEIKRFEDYFIVNAKLGEKNIRRDGSFNNGIFSVGANNVGSSMALELNNSKMICTNPPNFCQCDGAYKKVKSLVNPMQKAVNPEKEKSSSLAVAVPTQVSQTAPQIILDRDPLNFQLVNGGTVLLFDDVKNKDNEERMFDWSKLIYYYLPRLVLTNITDGNFAEVRQLDDKVFVFFLLTVKSIDKYELMEKIDESINTKILPNLVMPLAYEQMTVEFADSRTAAVVLAGSNTIPANGVFEISLPILRDSKLDIAEILKAGQDITASINNGSNVPVVSIKIIQQLATAKTHEGERVQVTKQWMVIR